MTKPTDEQIEGALIYVGKMRKWAIEEEDNNHLDVIRAALEEYGKPKTVTREWVNQVVEEADECGTGLLGIGCVKKNDFKSRLIQKLKEQGIEITGETPDDKS